MTAIPPASASDSVDMTLYVNEPPPETAGYDYHGAVHTALALDSDAETIQSIAAEARRLLFADRFDDALDVVSYWGTACSLFSKSELAEQAVRVMTEGRFLPDIQLESDHATLFDFLTTLRPSGSDSELAMIVALADGVWPTAGRALAVSLLSSESARAATLTCMVDFLVAGDCVDPLAAEMLTETLRTAISADLTPDESNDLDRDPHSSIDISLQSGDTNGRTDTRLEGHWRTDDLLRDPFALSIAGEISRLTDWSSWKFTASCLSLAEERLPFLAGVTQHVGVRIFPDEPGIRGLLYFVTRFESTNADEPAAPMSTLRQILLETRTLGGALQPALAAPVARRLAVSTCIMDGEKRAYDQVEAALYRDCDHGKDVGLLALKGLLLLMAGDLPGAASCTRAAADLADDPAAGPLARPAAAWLLLLHESCRTLLPGEYPELSKEILGVCRSANDSVARAAAAFVDDRGAADGAPLISAGDHADQLTKGNSWQRRLATLIRIVQTGRLINRGRYAHASRVVKYASALASRNFDHPRKTEFILDRMRSHSLAGSVTTND